jgi:signal transduction histidine kinase
MQLIYSTLPSASDESACDAMAGTGFDLRRVLDGRDFLARNDLLEPRYRASASLALAQIEELRSADRRKDEFLAMLAHELRSPLASIQSAVGVLRQPPAEKSLVQHSMHQLIERQVRQMARLVDGLLDVSRINRGELRLQRERIDLRVVLSNAIETIEPDLKQRCQRLATTLPESSRWLLADVGRLEQVFVNLLGNASKYTDEGGELALSMQFDDQSAVVRVRDSGIGIVPEALPHIFDLFTQCDPGAPRSISGLGVGLALVRAIVELHGGSVTATSAGLGLGSEFIVRLPCRS